MISDFLFRSIEIKSSTKSGRSSSWMGSDHYIQVVVDQYAGMHKQGRDCSNPRGEQSCQTYSWELSAFGATRILSRIATYAALDGLPVQICHLDINSSSLVLIIDGYFVLYRLPSGLTRFYPGFKRRIIVCWYTASSRGEKEKRTLVYHYKYYPCAWTRYSKLPPGEGRQYNLYSVYWRDVGPLLWEIKNIRHFKC